MSRTIGYIPGLSTFCTSVTFFSQDLTARSDLCMPECNIHVQKSTPEESDDSHTHGDSKPLSHLSERELSPFYTFLSGN